MKVNAIEVLKNSEFKFNIAKSGIKVGGMRYDFEEFAKLVKEWVIGQYT